jgi:hypothetical protein
MPAALALESRVEQIELPARTVTDAEYAVALDDKPFTDYSATVMSNTVGPEGGQVLVDRTVEAIQELWK